MRGLELSAFIVDIDFVVDPADRTAERHARAVGVYNTAGPAIRLQIIVRAEQLFLIRAVPVGRAQLVGAGRVIEAYNPDVRIAIVFERVVIGFVDSTEAESAPVDVSADVPDVTIMRCVVIILLDINSAVASADGYAGFADIAFPAR